MMDEKLIKTMGGEVEAFINDVAGRSFQCSCGNVIFISENDVLGYPHENGIEDATKKKWWAFVKCDKCKYDWSHWKVKNRLEKAYQ